jgi:hypothetical protein
LQVAQLKTAALGTRAGPTADIPFVSTNDVREREGRGGQRKSERECAREREIERLREKELVSRLTSPSSLPTMCVREGGGRERERECV